jgi:hypothetical protein
MPAAAPRIRTEQRTMANKYTHAELAERVKSSGWGLVTGKDGEPVTGTLEDVLKITHGRQRSGHAPGLIEEMATAIELDMFQIELLWRYLGLPV